MNIFAIMTIPLWTRGVPILQLYFTPLHYFTEHCWRVEPLLRKQTDYTHNCQKPMFHEALLICAARKWYDRACRDACRAACSAGSHGDCGITDRVAGGDHGHWGQRRRRGWCTGGCHLRCRRSRCFAWLLCCLGGTRRSALSLGARTIATEPSGDLDLVPCCTLLWWLDLLLVSVVVNWEVKLWGS